MSVRGGPEDVSRDPSIGGRLTTLIAGSGRKGKEPVRINEQHHSDRRTELADPGEEPHLSKWVATSRSRRRGRRRGGGGSQREDGRRLPRYQPIRARLLGASLAERVVNP